MDTLSHALVGIAIAGLSGHPLTVSDPIYLASILGAQAPDLDIIASVRGKFALLRQRPVLFPLITRAGPVVKFNYCGFFPRSSRCDAERDFYLVFSRRVITYHCRLFQCSWRACLMAALP